MSEKQGVGELFDFVKAYARQETLDPLKGAGRWLALGVAGSLLLMIGTLELTLALLRALQTETDTKLTGNLSWLPYVITLVAAALVA
ncbi:MAG: hypothetical protein ACE5GB_10720, partial [Acidimicrobiales bacterium]